MEPTPSTEDNNQRQAPELNPVLHPNYIIFLISTEDVQVTATRIIGRRLKADELETIERDLYECMLSDDALGCHIESVAEC